MSSSLDRYIGRFPVHRDLSRVASNAQLAKGKIQAAHEVGMYGLAGEMSLRNVLREIELSNPDAAPEAGVIVRLAVGGMIAAMLEFRGEL